MPFADSKEVSRKYRIIRYDEAIKAIPVFREYERKKKEREHVRWIILNSKPLYPAKQVYRFMRDKVTHR